MTAKLNKPTTVTDKEWKQAVREASGLVPNLDKTRWVIADLAYQVCHQSEFQRGDCPYTYKRFARSIGVQYKTLMEWCRVKRNVVDKLPVKIQEKLNVLPFDLFKRTSLKVDDDTVPKEVARVFRIESGMDMYSLRYAKYNKNLGTLLYNVSRPIRLKEIPDDLLIESLQKCKLIASFLEKEMKFRKDHGEASGVSDVREIEGISKMVQNMV